MPWQFLIRRFATVTTVVVLVTFGAVGCADLDDLVGTCCCQTANQGNSIKGRKECTDQGGICTNINVCSPNEPVDSRSAVVSKPNAGIGRAELRAPGVAAQLTEGVPDFKCDSVCESSPNCIHLVLPQKGPGALAISKGTRLLAQRALNRSIQVIRKVDVLTWYSSTTDPCNRGDTSLSSSSVVNRGNGCAIRFSMESTNGGLDGMLEIPAVLRFRILPGALNKKSVTLGIDTGGTPPVLTFADTQLNQQWGGQLVSVQIGAERSFIGIRTPSLNRCAEVSYAR